MIKLIVFTLFIVINSMATTIHLQKFQREYPQYMDSKYSTSCMICHKIPGGPLNGYGMAVQKNRLKFEKFEDIDSDGDLILNIDEINFLSNPGDKFSTPDKI